MEKITGETFGDIAGGKLFLGLGFRFLTELFERRQPQRFSPTEYFIARESAHHQAALELRCAYLALEIHRA